MSVATTIKRIRNTMLLEQEDFANLIGVKRQSVSNYERGKRRPPYSILRKIKAVADENNIEVKIEDLLDEK